MSAPYRDIDARRPGSADRPIGRDQPGHDLRAKHRGERPRGRPPRRRWPGAVATDSEHDLLRPVGSAVRLELECAVSALDPIYSDLFLDRQVMALSELVC